ncbi:hypothetical protein VNO80_10532 [Phaseolus coccineus]|uniref:Uncharacterized protein n=1 Tax=Phaseolus coccineus TaxID=3886 RepID=A0AAN9N8U9_PHACN
MIANKMAGRVKGISLAVCLEKLFKILKNWVSRILLDGFGFSQLGEGLGTFGLNLGGDLGWFLVFGKKSRLVLT